MNKKKRQKVLITSRLAINQERKEEKKKLNNETKRGKKELQ